MRNRDPWSLWCPLAAGLAALVIVTGPVRGQAGSSASSAQDQSKNTDPVVRTFGAEGGYRTELTSTTEGTLNDEDRRQVSLLIGPGLPAHRERRVTRSTPKTPRKRSRK